MSVPTECCKLLTGIDGTHGVGHMDVGSAEIQSCVENPRIEARLETELALQPHPVAVLKTIKRIRSDLGCPVERLQPHLR